MTARIVAQESSSVTRNQRWPADCVRTVSVSLLARFSKHSAPEPPWRKEATLFLFPASLDTRGTWRSGGITIAQIDHMVPGVGVACPERSRGKPTRPGLTGSG